MFWIYVFSTSLFIALSNLFIRKSVDAGGGAGDPYLMIRLFVSALFMVAIAIGTTGGFPLNIPMSFLGVIAGILLGTLMWLGGRSLKYGGPGFTFMVINSACIVPPIIMALLFGQKFGYQYQFLEGAGALLMIGGLWVGTREEKGELARPWYKWVTLAFLVHATYLSYFQWRALTLKTDLPYSTFIFQCSPEGSDCFGIALFVTATLFQLILPSNWQNATIKPLLIWGIGGGIINGMGSLAMLKATESAELAVEKSLLFPLYLILLTLFCNAWGAYFYKEKISTMSVVLLIAGICVSSFTRFL